MSPPPPGTTGWALGMLCPGRALSWLPVGARSVEGSEGMELPVRGKSCRGRDKAPGAAPRPPQLVGISRACSFPAGRILHPWGDDFLSRPLPVQQPLSKAGDGALGSRPPTPFLEDLKDSRLLAPSSSVAPTEDALSLLLCPPRPSSCPRRSPSGAADPGDAAAAPSEHRQPPRPPRLTWQRGFTEPSEGLWHMGGGIKPGLMGPTTSQSIPALSSATPSPVPLVPTPIPVPLPPPKGFPFAPGCENRLSGMPGVSITPMVPSLPSPTRVHPPPALPPSSPAALSRPPRPLRGQTHRQALRRRSSTHGLGVGGRPGWLSPARGHQQRWPSSPPPRPAPGIICRQQGGRKLICFEEEIKKINSETSSVDPHPLPQRENLMSCQRGRGGLIIARAPTEPPRSPLPWVRGHPPAGGVPCTQPAPGEEGTHQWRGGRKALKTPQWPAPGPQTA